MTTLLAQLLRALAAWLELKVLSYSDDREETLLKRLESQTVFIDKHRAIGDDDSTNAADLMFIKAQDTKSQLNHLRSRRAEIAQGSAGKDA